jgi:hypothetical protein
MRIKQENRQPESPVERNLDFAFAGAYKTRICQR